MSLIAWNKFFLLDKNEAIFRKIHIVHPSFPDQSSPRIHFPFLQHYSWFGNVEILINDNQDIQLFNNLPMYY